MRGKEELLELIRIRLEAIGHDRYASNSMARQAALDGLKDLEALKKLVCAVKKPRGPNSPRGDGSYSPGFEEFWKAYPARQGAKTGKATACASWNRLITGKGPLGRAIQEELLLSRCLEALSWQVKSEQWREANGKYIPMASTWLNNRRFEDERPEPEKEESVLF